jgi:LCP family protein required for cell wall assembly
MRVPGWIFIVGLFGLVAATALCAFGAYIAAREVAVDFANPPTQVAFATRQATNTAPPSPAPPTNTPEPGVTFTPEPTLPTEPTGTPDPLDELPSWNDPRRITILLMGIDQRSAVQSTETAFNTDTMILVQINPVRRTIGVLSIPRDLYVDIPNFQPGRITTANQLGDAFALPQGGPGLAMETVRRNLGVDVDHYVRINFDVFLTVVETIAPDGVEIDIPQGFVDEKYPDAGFGTIRVEFEAGLQTLNAERLLQYARTRATEGSDFDRSQRQQAVLRALQSELLSAGGILSFSTQIPGLYDELTDNFETSLSLDEIFRLARLIAEIPQENITFGAIGVGQVEFGTTVDGAQQILLPIQSAIVQVISDTFDPPPTDLTLGDLRERAENERASIVIFNNTDISGLAGQTRDWLNIRSVDVLDVGNILPSESALTTIRDYTGNPWTARYLAALLNLPADRIIAANDDLTDADIMIAVGPDIQGILSGQ